MIELSEKERIHHAGVQTSPWMIIGSVFILLVIVVILAAHNYDREKRYISEIMSEKGAALIMAVEAGARTGMMGMNWGGAQVQTLIEDAARLPGVLFLAVIDRNGVILADSDQRLVGSKFNQRVPINQMKMSAKTQWRVITDETHRRVFEVYKYFRPVSVKDFQPAGRTGRQVENRSNMACSENDWCNPIALDRSEHTILAGLDPSPFDDARKEDIRNTIFMSGVLVVLGWAGFISLFWFQHYRAARQSLQDTQAFANEIVTSLPVGLLVTDCQGRIAVFNAAAEKITGLDLSAAIGEYPEKVLPDSISGLRQTLDAGQSIYEREMVCEFTDGNLVPLSVSASRIIGETGRFVGHVFIFRNLEEVRRLQSEVRRKDRLAAIGGLAAGVAHEIRNPLSSIKGIASYFKGKFTQDDDDKEAADVMIHEVDRLNRVVSELLEFARPSEPDLKETDINELLKHAARLVQQEAAAMSVRIDLKLSGEPLTAWIDGDRFLQCFLNLYLNALQAMPDGGLLSISSVMTEDASVQIDVRDTGAGIRAEDMPRIFDPFFTTKPRGAGLGLAIVYGIIEAHHGQITVDSIPAQGTVFTIRIPQHMI